MGYEVTVYVRKPYSDGRTGNWEYKGVTIRCLPCIKNKYLETISHTLLAVVDSLQYKYDVYYFHAVVTGMFVPLAKLFGKRVLLQTHGLDWKREKWNWFAKYVIKISTRFGLWCTDSIVAVSLEEVEYFEKHYSKRVTHLPNGISVPKLSLNTDEIEKYNVYTGKYVLFLSRLVPEKGCHILIDAWKNLDANLKKDYKLVIAGDTPYREKYYYSLKENESEDIVFTGFATGELKKQLLTHAALFVQPSTMEGMPLTVLEAMGYGIPVIGSDIKEISEIVLDKKLLFESGNAEGLKFVLEQTLHSIETHQNFAKAKKEEVIAKYSWDSTAEKLDGIIRGLIK